MPRKPAPRIKKGLKMISKRQKCHLEIKTGVKMCSAAGRYFFTNSTRRFLARPSSVELSAMGSCEPLPTAVRRLEAMP